MREQKLNIEGKFNSIFMEEYELYEKRYSYVLQHFWSTFGSSGCDKKTTIAETR